ncbi:MAG: acyl--CoA ligase [Clostridiales bacterium]|jgi:long-chain acyl-CoA synthetase|nr:acyl--CoA ligase [Clostridiales bacterium]
MQFDKATDMSMYDYITDNKESRNWQEIIYFDNKIKYKDFIALVDKLAYFFQSKGYKPGDNVAVCLPNIPQAVITIYALNKCGITANMIHPLMKDNGFLNIIKRTNPKMLFVSDALYNNYKNVLKTAAVETVVCKTANYAPIYAKPVIAHKLKKAGINVVYGGNILKFSDLIKESGEIVYKPTGKDTAFYLHSGGTTGEPKTVVLSNYALNKYAQTAIDSYLESVDKRAAKNPEIKDKITPERYGPGFVKGIMLMVMPLFHGFGLGFCMHMAIRVGGSIVMIPKFDAAPVAKTLKKHNVNFVVGVPSMFDKLLKQKDFKEADFSGYKLIATGGDSINPEKKAEINEVLRVGGSGVRIGESYGLTETVTTLAVDFDGKEKPHNLGPLMKGVKIKVVNDDMQELKTGEAGELWVSCPYIMDGYYDDPKATAATLYTDKNGETWVKTGDIGFFDENGDIYMKGRKKRIIIISGLNVYPVEIETLVYSIKEIRLCCAIESKNRSGNTVVKLCVVPEDGYVLDDALKAKITALCRENLITYAVPKEIIAKDDLPLTLIGKVDYRKCQAEENNTPEEVKPEQNI